MRSGRSRPLAGMISSKEQLPIAGIQYADQSWNSDQIRYNKPSMAATLTNWSFAI
jgi:hypothetical protein